MNFEKKIDKVIEIIKSKGDLHSPFSSFQYFFSNDMVDILIERMSLDIDGSSLKPITDPPHNIENEMYVNMAHSLLASKYDSLETGMKQIKETLIYKNGKYGNSILQPLQALSDCKPFDVITSRIDEKINRILNNENDDEDAVLDWLGYLFFLLMVVYDLK
jgi:hypothetical protein